MQLRNCGRRRAIHRLSWVSSARCWPVACPADATSAGLSASALTYLPPQRPDLLDRRSVRSRHPLQQLWLYRCWHAVVVTVANTTISGLLTIDEDASFYRSVLQRASQRMADAARPSLSRILFLGDRRPLRAGAAPCARHRSHAGPGAPAGKRLTRVEAWETRPVQPDGSWPQPASYVATTQYQPFAGWRGGTTRVGEQLRPARCQGHRGNASPTAAAADCGETAACRQPLHRRCGRTSCLSYSAQPAWPNSTRPLFCVFANPYSFVRTLSPDGVDMVRELTGAGTRNGSTFFPGWANDGASLSDLRAAAADATARRHRRYAHHRRPLRVMPTSSMRRCRYDSGASSASSTRTPSRALATDRRLCPRRGAPHRCRPAVPVRHPFDHGQTRGATFKQRCGVTRSNRPSELLPTSDSRQLQTDEEWGRGRPRQRSGAAGSHAGPFRAHRARASALDSEVRSAPTTSVCSTAGRRIITAEEAQLIVLASGSLGLVCYRLAKDG